MSTTRTITQLPDGTLDIKVTDTRTIEQKLTATSLTFAEKLDRMYPTTDVKIGGMSFDNHKRCK
jgi:hypothetical protein|tara:strand:- start:2160 stop:2351 length:192 start_codon:yes stop_codon:yes gene_type:complete